MTYLSDEESAQTMTEQRASRRTSEHMDNDQHPRATFEHAAQAYAADLRRLGIPSRRRVLALVMGAKKLIFLAQDDVSFANDAPINRRGENALRKLRSLLEYFDNMTRKGSY